MKNNNEFLSNVEAVFNQARETERFGEERYQAGIKEGREEQANKSYTKALELNIPEEIAREIACLKK